jgi:hypothetical protein
MRRVQFRLHASQRLAEMFAELGMSGLHGNSIFDRRPRASAIAQRQKAFGQPDVRIRQPWTVAVLSLKELQSTLQIRSPLACPSNANQRAPVK